MNFLDHLNLSADLMRKLESLGADTPEALLSIAAASPEAFANFLGREEAQRIQDQVRSIVDSDHSHIWTAPVLQYSLGANLSSRPHIPPPRFDIAQRDKLFAEIQALRQSADPSDSLKLSRLELELNELLDQA